MIPNIAPLSLRPCLLCLIFLDLIVVGPPAQAYFGDSELPSRIKEIYRFDGNRYRFFPDDIFLNRHGQLATVLSDQRHSESVLSEYLLYYSKEQGFFKAHFPEDSRELSVSFSDGGAVVQVVGRNSDPWEVLTGPFGQPLQEIYSFEGGTIGAPAINDDGVVAFASRSATNHGLRDLWRYRPGGPLESLPDLAEISLEGSTLIDPQGRVIQSHEFDEGESNRRTILRLDSNGNWDDLTLGLGDPAERFFEAVGTNAVNASGDFAFLSNSPGAELPYRLNAYYATDDSYVRVLESADPLSLVAEIHVTMADNGDIMFWLGNGSISALYYVYRKEEDQLYELTSLAPINTLATYPYMNQNGDVIFGGRDPDTKLYNYYLSKAGSSKATSINALSNLNGALYRLGLSNDLTIYTWLHFDVDQWSLGVATIPEPSSLILLIVAIGLVSLGHRRKAAGSH